MGGQVYSLPLVIKWQLIEASYEILLNNDTRFMDVHIF